MGYVIFTYHFDIAFTSHKRQAKKRTHNFYYHYYCFVSISNCNYGIYVTRMSIFCMWQTMGYMGYYAKVLVTAIHGKHACGGHRHHLFPSDHRLDSIRLTSTPHFSLQNHSAAHLFTLCNHP